MKLTRVLLAEDHTLVRAGIRALLHNLTGIQVVAEASDGREALRLIKTYHPDVVLMDIAMAGLNGLEATARVTQEFPTVRVIILSMHSNEEYVAQALRAGAAGYLLKDAAAAELELAVTAVARGETYISQSGDVETCHRRLPAACQWWRGWRRWGSDPGLRTADPTPARNLTAHRRRTLHQGDRVDPAPQCENDRDPPHAVDGPA